jgi:hemin uptake protein HemP
MADIKKIATRVSYGNTLVELAQQGADNLVVFDADLAAATKTEIFRKEYPDRHFDCGIAEQNMVGVAAGMEIEVQQRCVRAGRRKQTANLLRGDHEILIGHGGGSFLFFFFLKNHHYSTEFSLRQGSMSGCGVKILGKETKRLQFS